MNLTITGRLLCFVATAVTVVAEPLQPLADEGKFDFGTVAVGQPVAHAFVIHNESDSAMPVADVESSCECLRIVSYPDTIAPRSSGRIEVFLRPANPGQMSYEITAKLLTPEADTRVFRMLGEVVTSVVVRAVSSGIVAPEGDTPARRIHQRDADCYVLARDVMSGSKHVTFIDVRSSFAFAAVHMPSSLNIAASSLKTKSFLKTKDVVLVDEGFGSEELERTCRELRGNGFGFVSILYGGLNAWVHAGGELVGDAEAKKRIDKMPIGVLDGALGYDDWLIVDASRSADAGEASIVAHRVSVPDDAQCAASLGQLVTEKRGQASVLVVTRKGEEAEQVAVRLRSAHANVFVLEGGFDAYVTQLRQRTDSAVSRTQTLTGSTPAQSSPMGRPAAARGGKGCGKCPG